MTIENLTNILNQHKNGTVASIKYSGTVSKINAATKKAGIKITSETTGLVRYGIDYNNISIVKEAKELGLMSDSDKENNWVWIVKNKIAHNTKTGTTALRIINLQSDKFKKNKIFTAHFSDNSSKQISIDELREYVQPSYFNNSGSKPIVQWIKIEDIIELNHTN